MSDLADTIDDLICSFESDGKTMDTLIMYLFCWALVGFAALAAGKFVYGRFVGYATRKSGTAATVAAEPDAAGDRKHAQHHHRVVPPTPPVARKRLGSKSGRTSAAVAGIAAGLSAVPAAAAANRAFSHDQPLQAHHHSHHSHRPLVPPKVTGNEPDAVRWTNEVFQWLYNVAAGGGGEAGEPSIVDYLLGEWIAALNEYTKKSFAEVSPYNVIIPCVLLLPLYMYRWTIL